MKPSILWKTAAVAVIAGLFCASLAEARGGGARPGGAGAGRMGGGRGATRGTTAGRSKTDNSEEAMKELEDRTELIAERRKHLGDSDREANQEARLAAGRLDTAVDRTGGDVR